MTYEENLNKIYKGFLEYQTMMDNNYSCDAIIRKNLKLNFNDIYYQDNMVRICTLLNRLQNKISIYSVKKNYDNDIIYNGHEELKNLIRYTYPNFKICNTLDIEIFNNVPESQNNTIFHKNINKICSIVEMGLVKEYKNIISNHLDNIADFQLQELKN